MLKRTCLKVENLIVSNSLPMKQDASKELVSSQNAAKKGKISSSN